MGTTSAIEEVSLKYASQSLPTDDDALGYLQRLIAGTPAFETPLPRPRRHLALAGKQASRLTRCQELSTALTERVRGLSADSGIPLSAVLLASFAAVLHRYAGATEICVATRYRRSDSSLVRRYAAPLWLSVQTDRPFSDLLRDVTSSMAAADGVSDQLAVEDLLSSPAVPCYFGPSTPTSAASYLVSVVVDEPDAGTDPGRQEGPVKGLILHWSPGEDAIEPAALDRMIDHFEYLLQEAVEDPGRFVGDVPMVTPAERRQFSHWNATSVPRPAKTVVDLFEQTTARVPSAQAVIDADGALSYEDLHRRVEYLSRQLRATGVGQGTRVAVLMERSPGLYIAMLAIMMAGGTYIPLDPQHPEQRIAAVLEDASVALLLSDGQLGSTLSVLVPLAVRLDSEGIATLPPAGRAETETWRPTPDDLAYVVYTSGTTGRPKGVEVPHSALTNLLLHFDAETGIGEGDTVAGITTVTFDISLLELCLPLVRGARLALLSRATTTDGYELCDALVRYQVSFMQATPMTWRMLMDSDWQGDSRLTALCGGETTPPDLAEQLAARVGRAWNVYGPSETTVWSTTHRIRELSSTVPIGRPIANTTLHVLDKRRQLVPIGIPGELYIGGAGVARGYLGRPDLTQDRFVAASHSVENELLYRTGDLARWSEDGELDFLGRIDRQVKIRGFRIELEEIEAALNLHPGVRHGVVDVRASTAGQQQIVGYVVLHTPDNRVLADISDALAEQLPDYMVPRPLLAITELPMSANGKVLRDQLPMPDWARQFTSRVGFASLLEEQLATIWAEVLHVDNVLPDEDFFDLGGTSLLAQHLSARIRSVLNVRIRLSTLIEHPTVSALAASLLRDSISN